MNEGEMVQVSVRVPVEMADALQRVARENDRTVSAELRRLIRLNCLPRVVSGQAWGPDHPSYDEMGQ